MTNTAEKTSLQQVARTFFHWFDGGDPGPGSIEGIQDYLGSPISLRELQRLGDRLRENQAFIDKQRPLIDKWRRYMESPQGLSEEQAYALIQELFEGFDHALLYEHGIRASSTRMRRGSIAASETAIDEMPCWTLHLTLRGSALFLNDDMEAQVCAGDMMLLRPEAHYHYGLHPRADYWEHLWALFQPRSHWADLLKWRELDRGILLLPLPDEASRMQMEGLFRELIDLGEASGTMQSDLQHNKLEEILIRARGYSTRPSDTSIDPRVTLACQYMQQHLANKFSVEDVADACNLSTSRLAHLFKDEMGIGPKAWINDARLQQARKLLLNSSASISQVSARVGYEDPSHFTRYFKQNMGCSPRQFRQTFGGGQRQPGARVQV